MARNSLSMISLNDEDDDSRRCSRGSFVGQNNLRSGVLF